MKPKWIIRENGRSESSPAKRAAAAARMAQVVAERNRAKKECEEIRARLLAVPEYQKAWLARNAADRAYEDTVREQFYFRFSAAEPFGIGLRIAGRGDSRTEAIRSAEESR